MRSLSPLVIVATATVLMACEPSRVSPEPVAAPVATDAFIASTADMDRSDLPALSAAFDADPLGVADRLEADFGGHSAVRRYAVAMIEQGRAEHLGRQLSSVLNKGASLGRPENRDGAVWYPRAEDAGFVTGGFGAVLAAHPDALPAFAKGVGRSPPGAGDDLQTWLSAPAAELSRPARSAFDDAFRAAAYRPGKTD